MNSLAKAILPPTTIGWPVAELNIAFRAWGRQRPSGYKSGTISVPIPVNNIYSNSSLNENGTQTYACHQTERNGEHGALLLRKASAMHHGTRTIDSEKHRHTASPRRIYPFIGPRVEGEDMIPTWKIVKANKTKKKKKIRVKIWPRIDICSTWNDIVGGLDEVLGGNTSPPWPPIFQACKRPWLESARCKRMKEQKPTRMQSKKEAKWPGNKVVAKAGTRSWG